VTRRVASVLRDADVCTQKQKAAAERVAESTKKREEAERTLRLAEAASRLAGDAFDPVAAARDAAASMSRRTTPSRTSLERRSDEASAAESSLESSPESDAPPKKKDSRHPALARRAGGALEGPLVDAGARARRGPRRGERAR